LRQATVVARQTRTGAWHPARSERKTHAMYLAQGLHRAMANTPGATATVFGKRRRSVAQRGDHVARLAGGPRGGCLAPDARIGMRALGCDRDLAYCLGTDSTCFAVIPANMRWRCGCHARVHPGPFAAGAAGSHPAWA
jgi:hypothetical protein